MSDGDRPEAAHRSGETVFDDAKVAAARLWATNRFPYLASAIFASPALPAPGLGRIVIDRSWRIHADPEVVDDASVAALGGELLHLTTHVLRDHAARADDMGLGEQAELHHWVDAADAEINDDLPTGLERVSPAVVPAELGVEDGRLAEEYYRQGEVREAMTNDCGSGAHGRLAAWEPPPTQSSDDPGVEQGEQQLLRRRVAADVAAADAASTSAGLRAWADAQLGAKVDWRAELAAVVRRSIASVGGAVDYSYARPARRAVAVEGVILPSLRRPVIEVAVVCDTSASVSDVLLGQAVAEIDGLIRATGTRTMRVLACDDAVQATAKVTNGRDVVLLGGGGTDMAIGIDAAMDHRPRPQLVVVLTDGYTPWPSSGPQAQVVVGLLDSDEMVGPPNPPAWATTVSINDDTSPGRSPA